MPTRMNADPKSRYSVSFIAAYSFVPTPVSRYAHAKMPRGRISPLEPQTPISRYIGRTASSEDRKKTRRAGGEDGEEEGLTRWIGSIEQLTCRCGLSGCGG